jgi:sigma-B regulation protein RsbU (phosphoserine phosphatase)
LHSLIHASKTKKQKKIMTFQYLYLDSVNGTGIYSNAGACSPIIIRKAENRVEELKLPGAALGAFKKAKYSEIEISFAPGDAIVFYTDGIVEARGDNDEEMGYDELKRLLLRSWDLNAEKFYRNIYQEYLKHLGSQSAQDDLTMVVLVYTANENSLADEADGNQKKEMS